MSSYSELESLRTVDLLRLSFNRTPLKNASVGRFFFLISRFFSISTSWILSEFWWRIPNFGKEYRPLKYALCTSRISVTLCCSAQSTCSTARKILNLEIKCNSVTWTVYVTVWHNPGSLVQTLSDIIMFKNTFLYTLLLTFLCFFALVVDF